MGPTLWELGLMPPPMGKGTVFLILTEIQWRNIHIFKMSKYEHPRGDINATVYKSIHYNSLLYSTYFRGFPRKTTGCLFFYFNQYSMDRTLKKKIFIDIPQWPTACTVQNVQQALSRCYKCVYFYFLHKNIRSIWTPLDGYISKTTPGKYFNLQ